MVCSGIVRSNSVNNVKNQISGKEKKRFMLMRDILYNGKVGRNTFCCEKKRLADGWTSAALTAPQVESQGKPVRKQE